MVSEKREKIKNSMTAKHCTINGLNFDSLSEANFYMRLCRIFGIDNVKRGEKLCILPKSECSPGIWWMPDFSVTYFNVDFIVEFKGTLKPGTHGRDSFLLKWAVIHATTASVSLNRFMVFTHRREDCKWNTTNGRQTIPSLFNAESMSDDDILVYFKIRHNLLS